MLLWPLFMLRISLFDCVKKFKLNDTAIVEERHEPMLKCTIMYVKDLEALYEVEIMLVKIFF